MGNWGDSSQGWQVCGQPGGVRQIPSIAKNFTPTTTSNRYNALPSKVSNDIDIEPSLKMTEPIIYDTIVWKGKDVRRKRRKHVDNKSDDYLCNGKSFSLDSYVKMQGEKVGRDLNSGMKISASRTEGTEEFDKHVSNIAI